MRVRSYRPPYGHGQTPHIPRMVEPLETRTLRRFAWFPVHLTGEPWYRRASWVWLDWYLATETLEPDYGGVSTGHWLRIHAAPLTE